MDSAGAVALRGTGVGSAGALYRPSGRAGAADARRHSRRNPQRQTAGVGRELAEVAAAILAATQGTYRWAYPSQHQYPAWKLIVWRNSTDFKSFFLLADEHGTELVHPLLLDNSEQDGALSIGSYALQVFPRRGQRLQVSLRMPGMRNEPAYTCFVANPLPGPYPVWKPDPLPVTRRAGDLQVTVDGYESPAAQQSGSVRKTRRGRLRLRLHERNQPAARDWALTSVTLLDPTGNSWELPFSVHPVGNEQLLVDLGAASVTPEPAHRLALEFCRRDHFSAEDQWIVPGIRAAPSGKPIRFRKQRTLHGYTAELLDVWREKASLKAAIRLSGPGSPAAFFGFGRLAGLRGRYLSRVAFRSGTTFQEPQSFTYGNADSVLVEVPRVNPMAKVTMRWTVTPCRRVEFLAHVLLPPYPLARAKTGK